MAAEGRPAAPRTAEALRRAARRHAAEAISALVEIVRTGASEHARVAAAKELLDRGHGKPASAPAKGGGDAAGTSLRQVIRWALEAEAVPDPSSMRPSLPKPAEGEN